MSRRTRRIINAVAVTLLVLILAFIIWLDIVSGIWAETVILSGIAAGIVTFLLTALLIERFMEVREHRKWYPVTRLALNDILHALSDDELSDIRRGHVVPRKLSAPNELTVEHLDELLHMVVVERDDVTAALARWAQFLAASADVQELMVHIANLAESLDDIRDCAVELEANPAGTIQNQNELRAELAAYSDATNQVIQEILTILKKLSDTEETDFQ